MFSRRSASATVIGALLLVTPLAVGAPAEAEPNEAVASTCVARIGVPISCKVVSTTAFGSAEASTEATGLPPGLEVTADGRIIGTPTAPGITQVQFTTDGTTKAVPVVVSDVDYIAATLSADGTTIVGTRWDGTRVTLHQGLSAFDVRGLGIHPNGSVYLLTAARLVRIVRPGQVSVVLDGLQSEALDITPSGEMHVASRNEIISVQPDGQVFLRARGAKVMDVLEDHAGDVWTLEFVGDRRFLHHIDTVTGEVHRLEVGYSPSSIAENRGQIYVTSNATVSAPTQVVATDRSGSTTVLPLPEKSFRLEYSDLFGLTAVYRLENTQPALGELALGAPLSYSQIGEPAVQRIAAPEHLRRTE